MTQDIDLKKIERRAFLSFHQDGIYDLFIGLSLMSVAACIIFDVTDFAIIGPALSVILAPWLKKVLTSPRLGYVKFSPQRENREKSSRNVLVMMFTVTAILGGVVSWGWSGDSPWQIWIRDLGAIPFGFVLAIASLTLGYLYEIRRCHLYALIILGAFVGGHLYDLRMWFQLGLPGIVLTFTGLALLIRHLSRYPKPSPEATNGL